MSKTRTITLTGRRPVTIDEADWPIIARANDDNCEIRDPARYQQALDQGQADEYTLRVRRHEDGRAIVYGTYTESILGSDHDGLDRAGEIVPAGESIEAAIERVGDTLGVPAQLVADAIADLPAEKL